MNKKNLRTRRITAVIIALVIVGLSMASDFALSKNEEKSNLVMDEFEKLVGLGEKPLKEDIITEGNPKARILVVPIRGTIQDGGMNSLNGQYNHGLTMEVLANVQEDKTIKGIILDVDSPGGTVYHSAQVWQMIKNLKASSDLPIYTSMGTMAASGGYYVAAATDKIFAAKETTTGSIGVIADYVNYSQLESKLGIEHNVMKSGAHKDIGSPNREMTEEDRIILQKMVDDSYLDFLKVVSTGRKLSMDKVKKIADGRIYSGQQALDLGLVDEIGYMGDAIESMSELIKEDQPQVFEISQGGLDYFSGLLNLKSRQQKDNELSVIRDLNEIYGANNSARLLYIHGGY